MCEAMSHKYCLDHSSTDSQLNDDDVASQVTRYLEFKTVDGSYVVKGGKVNKVRGGAN